MKELSLNILDIAQNSVKAGAEHLEIALEQAGNRLTITISDDGCGMSPEFLSAVTDPFTTTRTTRKVGMGLPLFKLAAEQTGGTLSIASKQASPDDPTHGTYGLMIMSAVRLGGMATVAALLAFWIVNYVRASRARRLTMGLDAQTPTPAGLSGSV